MEYPKIDDVTLRTQLYQRSELLRWYLCDGWQEGHLQDFEGGDGVRFTITYARTCYRRGPYKLLIEVAHGPNHEKWGCFDGQDQPMRYYHNDFALHAEIDAIAKVLLEDRRKADEV